MRKKYHHQNVCKNWTKHKLHQPIHEKWTHIQILSYFQACIYYMGNPIWYIYSEYVHLHVTVNWNCVYKCIVCMYINILHYYADIVRTNRWCFGSFSFIIPSHPLFHQIYIALGTHVCKQCTCTCIMTGSHKSITCFNLSLMSRPAYTPQKHICL